MFCFAGMLENHIKNSKLKQPSDFENYDPNEYPHFHVFQTLHLGCPIDISSLEENANVVADIPEDTIRQITLEQLVEKGLWIEHGNNLV